MQILTEIERQHNTTLPKAYRAFAERGYLTYPGSTYLWMHEAKWFPPHELLDRRPIWGNPKPGLVAFAFTAGRDLWCWQTLRVSERGEPTVVLCPRDSYEGEWYAPSFIGWLYRLALDYVTPLWDEEPEAKLHLRQWAALIREFSQPAWAADLEVVAAGPVLVSQEENRGDQQSPALLTSDEVTNRIRSAFGDAYVDAPYVWDIEGESKEC